MGGAGLGMLEPKVFLGSQRICIPVSTVDKWLPRDQRQM